MKPRQQIVIEESRSESNLEKIVQLLNAFFPEPENIENIKKEFEKSKHGVYVAKINGEIIGANIWVEDSGGIYDWYHVVDANHRKRGVGSKLMDYLISNAKKSGHPKIELKTYNLFHSMIRLCRRKGFVRTKKEPDVWGDNKYAIYYQLNLANGSSYKDFEEKIKELNGEKVG